MVAAPRRVTGMAHIRITVSATSWADRGTHAKEWFGLAPIGVAVVFTECAFYKVRDRRFESSWYLMDAAAVQQQLGG